MLLQFLLIFQLLLASVVYANSELQMKQLHSSKSIEHSGSTISLRVYENLQSTLLSSLEIIRVEDIYEGDSKIAQSIHIVTYYYDISDITTDRFLQPVDKKHNKVFASLMSATDSTTDNIELGEKLGDLVASDHGFQDGVNNKLLDPMISVIARTVGQKLQIRGSMMEYREDLTADDMLQDNFEIEVDFISKELSEEKPASKKKVEFLVSAAVILLVFLFIINSDVYNS